MEDQVLLEKGLNYFVKENFPFVKSIEVVHIILRWNQMLIVEMNILIDNEKKKDLIDLNKDCVKNYYGDVMSLNTFNRCSGNKLDPDKLNQAVLDIGNLLNLSGELRLYVETDSVIHWV